MSDQRRPDFKISLDGSPLPDDVVARMIEIKVDDALDKAAIALLRLRCEIMSPEPDKGDAGRFKAGAELKIELGYIADTSQVFLGEITSLWGSYPRRGNPTLTVIAMDKFHRLRRNTRQATFTEQPASDAIKKVLTDAGLTSSDVESTSTQQAYMVQFNQTDAQFVIDRAKRVGLVVRMDPQGKLIVEKPKLDAGAVATLTWHKELESFEVGISIANQQNELTTSSWDAAKKERVEHTVKGGQEPSKMGGTITGADITKDLGTQPTVFPHTPCTDPAEMQDLAETAFASRSMDFVTGEGTCTGNPAILRGTVVEIMGIGSFLEGPYYVTQAIHSLFEGSGYTTTFRVARTAVQAPAPEPARTEEDAAVESQPHEVEPDPQPLSFEVTAPDGKPLQGVPYVLSSPDGERKPGQLSSDGKVEIDFQDE